MSRRSGTHVERSWPQAAALVALTGGMWVAAVIGMAYVSGFGAVLARLEHAQWLWLLPSLGAIGVAFAAYSFAYRGIQVVEDGPELEPSMLVAVIAAGFGGFLTRGGASLDRFALRAHGASARDAKVRSAALAGFELAVLALIACPAAIVAVLGGVVIPRASFTWPWAVIPVPAAAVVVVAAERYRDRVRRKGRWRCAIAFALDTVHLVYALFKRPVRHWHALVGMAAFWAADMFALWAATAAFGVRMSILSTIIALATGMILTRRAAPIAGAGLLVVALVPTLWFGSAVPLAVATLGAGAYRLFSLWAPLPAALAATPKIRRLAGGSPRRQKRARARGKGPRRASARSAGR